MPRTLGMRHAHLRDRQVPVPLSDELRRPEWGGDAQRSCDQSTTAGPIRSTMQVSRRRSGWYAFMESALMRGPGYKLALDARRLWRCPACGYERRADGRATTLRCRCTVGPFMQLVSEPRFARKQNRPLDPYVSAEEILGPDESVAAVVASGAVAALPAVDLVAVAELPLGNAEATGAVAVAESPSVESVEGVATADSSANADARGPGQPSASEVRTGESRAGRNRHRPRGPRGPRPPQS